MSQSISAQSIRDSIQPSTKEEIVRLRMCGIGPSEIARRLHLRTSSVTTIIQRYSPTMHFPALRKTTTEADLERMKQLRLYGYSNHKIAEITGFSYTTVLGRLNTQPVEITNASIAARSSKRRANTTAAVAAASQMNDGRSEQRNVRYRLRLIQRLMNRVRSLNQMNLLSR